MTGSANEALGVHPLAEDQRAIHAFVHDFRANSDRVEVSIRKTSVRLNTRGTDLITAVMTASPSSLNRVSRALRKSMGRLGGVVRGSDNPQDCRSHLTRDFDRLRALIGCLQHGSDRATVAVGGSEARLTDRGTELVLGMLIASSKELHRVGRIVGTDSADLWVDGVPLSGHLARDDSFLYEHLMRPTGHLLRRLWARTN